MVANSRSAVLVGHDVRINKPDAEPDAYNNVTYAEPNAFSDREHRLQGFRSALRGNAVVQEGRQGYVQRQGLRLHVRAELVVTICGAAVLGLDNLLVGLR